MGVGQSVGKESAPKAGLRVLAVWVVLATLLAWVGCGLEASPERIVVARKIITMNPAQPVATAMGIDESGLISAVGSLEEVKARLNGDEIEIDRSLQDKVILPGFVDPHVHPTLAATILNLDIVSAMEWTTPRGKTKSVRGHEAFLARLRELDREREQGEWLSVWGYHAPYHGKLTRADLDQISTTRPIFVWQRSVHEMYFNSRALEELGMKEEDFELHPEADWEEGHLWERGTLALGAPMLAELTQPTKYLEGLSMMTEVYHRGGLTMLGEQGFPQVNKLAEKWSLRFEMWRSDAPYRFALVPNAMFLYRQEGSAEAAEAAATRMLEESSDGVQFVKHAKYFADGAIFSQLMQMKEPYLDGHHGEWMMTPEEQADVLETFWRKGWNLHVHVNGDAGLDEVLDQIEAQQNILPDPDRRIIMEHYGFAREDQHQRLARLGIEVSNNAYYLHELAPIYAEYGLGPERAADISPLGGLSRAGVPTSFHSDFPMAPAEPLTLAWTAVNRIGSDGRVWGPEQRISLERALRAITLEGARSLGLEDEIGSLEVGKRADLTVLDQDPYEVDPENLRDIPIWGTVLAGRPHPIPAEGQARQ
ncbi:MAG: amidohydrolase [Myxococcota bacterium]|nr:amidohydrolase [Myxococcota bacterium]